jgi:hypothetical protein
VDLLRFTDPRAMNFAEPGIFFADLFEFDRPLGYLAKSPRFCREDEL